MADRFTVPVEFQRLDDVEAHGHSSVVALKGVLDGAAVSEPDARGAFTVEIEAESQEDANDRVWLAAEEARITDFIDFVGRRTT